MVSQVGPGTHPKSHMPEAATSGRAERRLLALSSPKGVPRGTDPRGQAEDTDPREQKDIPQSHEGKELTTAPSDTMVKVEQELPPDPTWTPRRKRHPAHLCLYWPPLDATSASHQHLVGGRLDRRRGPGISRGLRTVLDIAGLPLGLG